MKDNYQCKKDVLNWLQHVRSDVFTAATMKNVYNIFEGK
jgi:hypothetical protein